MSDDNRIILSHSTKIKIQACLSRELVYLKTNKFSADGRNQNKINLRWYKTQGRVSKLILRNCRALSARDLPQLCVM